MTRNPMTCRLLLAAILVPQLASAAPVTDKPQYSGIYPHLAYFNDEGECGTGAVVPWADRLWVITYGPHLPLGSSDKLYEITPDLKKIIRPESIGGTPANRMIHRESNQLFIGPYAIDAERKVRVIPVKEMPGRLTGTARHLTDPANKIYTATMEEGLYEIDVRSLAVTEKIKDGNAQAAVGQGIISELPGYHGKGLYSSQGMLVYANNGEKSEQARKNPFIPSGALASWQGEGDWKLVRRNQFTEVTGPGGIFGNEHPETDPLWSVGWDARSVILMLLDKGKWHSYRLPKASHSYDGSHGWNTEWPRIRDIGEDELLMTMHGMFWKFPKTFTASNSKGIAPRSSYLKVIGDFSRWQDKIVLGCDDTAKSEFLNKRKAKGEIAAPQAQSNLWFIDPPQLDHLGPVIGRGAVWLNDAVAANTPSDPFLIDGFSKRMIHFTSDVPTTITLEIDAKGDGQWTKLSEVPVNGYAWKKIDASVAAVWMRVSSANKLTKATASFQMEGERAVSTRPDLFSGVARMGDTDATGGLVRALSSNKRTLQFASIHQKGEAGYYILDEEMKLKAVDSKKDLAWMNEHVAIPDRAGVLEVDAASVLYTDDDGKRFRIPGNPALKTAGPMGFGRICREVATERDLFNSHGTFFELPANNAGGFGRVRPVSSHDLDIKDYCSYRGMLILSGVNLAKAGNHPHIIRSDDGKTALWAGTIDDIWQLGKPVGVGGPWKATAVKANEVSDPYLMTGYDKKSLVLESSEPTEIKLEVDISGMGDWQAYQTFKVSPDKPVAYEFPDAFQAYWLRVSSSQATTATAQLEYR